MEKERRNKKTKSKGNGEGTIYYSETLEKWVAQYVEPTTGKRKTLTQRKTEKPNEFKKRFINIMNGVNNGTYIGTSKETVISIIERHVKEKYKDGITSDRSFARDLETIEQIKKCCSNFVDNPIQKVKLNDILISKSEIRKYSKSVIDKIWGLLFKAFRIASSPSTMLIPFNIMDDENLKKPISDKITKRVEALTIKEEKKLNKILDTTERNHKYRNIVKLELITAMRIGEVLARSKDNINKKNKKLLINNTLTEDTEGNIILGKHTKTYNKTTKVDEGVRNFPIDEEIEEIINEQTNQKTTNIYGLLFWDYEKNTFISPKEINAWLRRLNVKYGISKNLHNHKLRHTRITRMREANMDMKVIQYLVGHVEGSKVTDEVYTSVTPDFIDQELKKINA